jgi:hypothetical protein
MKLIIIENDFRRKHKLWKLMCLNHGSIDMDFIYGNVDVKSEDMKELFEGISVTLKDPMDAHKLEQILEYQLEYEFLNDRTNGDDNDDI